jgi:hypothetical protein
MTIYASDPAFADISRVVTQIAQLTNVHIFWDLRDMAEAERRAELARLVEVWEELAR